MLFNSLEFLVFLPAVFLLYWFVFKPRRWQNLFVVVASYIFYGWWDWRFLLLIAFTSLCSYMSGLWLERTDNITRRRIISGANIIVNLFILCLFKYYNFFVENIEALFSMCGYRLDWVTLNIVLPVGISFYTFQALSYSIDVYRRNIRATHDPIEFFAYISFFPQLVAGPIERATNLLPQFQRNRSFDYAKAVDGCRQILWGFFKKLVVADNCALIVNEYWNGFSGQTGFHILLVATLFTFQIYCDFSGYSDIAIGCARLFGFDLKRNFNYPFFSRNIAEFWRRWHISLMTWFRDYVYFPLGGSRCSKAKAMRNTLVVFLISGLWHGANWPFVAWGLYNGLLIVIGNMIGFNHKYTEDPAEGRFLPRFKELVKMVSVFFLAVMGLAIFRCRSIEQAAHLFSCLFSPSLFHFGGLDCLPTLAWCLVMMLAEWLQRDKQHALDLQGMKKGWIRYLVYTAVFLTIFGMMPNQMSEFIYFQF